MTRGAKLCGRLDTRAGLTKGEDVSRCVSPLARDWDERPAPAPAQVSWLARGPGGGAALSPRFSSKARCNTISHQNYIPAPRGPALHSARSFYNRRCRRAPGEARRHKGPALWAVGEADRRRVPRSSLEAGAKVKRQVGRRDSIISNRQAALAEARALEARSPAQPGARRATQLAAV